MDSKADKMCEEEIDGPKIRSTLLRVDENANRRDVHSSSSVDNESENVQRDSSSSVDNESENVSSKYAQFSSEECVSKHSAWGKLCCLGYANFVLAHFLVLVAGTFGVYTSSVLSNNTAAILPFVSSAGAKDPERPWFSLLGAIAAILGFCTVGLRYMDVDARDKFGKLRRFNKIAFAVGVLVMFSLLASTNFSVATDPTLHMWSAVVLFIAMLPYMCMQVKLTLFLTRNSETSVPRRTAYCRVALTFLYFCCMIVTFLGSALSGFAVEPNISIAAQLAIERSHWHPDEPGYITHVMATAAEWVGIFTGQAFLLTFIPEFKRIKLRLLISSTSTQ